MLCKFQSVEEIGLNCISGTIGIRGSFADFQLSSFAMEDEVMKDITTCKTSFEGECLCKDLSISCCKNLMQSLYYTQEISSSGAEVILIYQ